MSPFFPESSGKMNATAVLAVYSRLLIEPNRPLGNPECIPVASDGTLIPANTDLSDADNFSDAMGYPNGQCHPL